jgi:hypothetical protein
VDIDVDRQHDLLQVGYAFMRETNGAPIATYRDYKDVTTVLSMNYNFTPLVNFSLRGRHYWSRVKHLSFWNVDKDGNHYPRAFINNRDQSLNFFNIDAFFNWDFRPGSRIVAGWKNWLGSSYLEEMGSLRFRNYGKNFRHVFDLPHGNEFTVRMVYFLDYNQLRRKK